MELREQFSQEEAVEYIKKKQIFADNNNISAKSLNANSLSINGFANNLFLIENKTSCKKIVFKQLLSYVRRAAEDDNVKIPLPIERIYSEYYSVKLFAGIQPGSVPKIYLFDRDNKIIIYEYIDDMELFRSSLIKRKKLKNFSQQVAEFLAKISFYSSARFLGEKKFSLLDKLFAQAKPVHIWDELLFESVIYDPRNKSINCYLEDKILDFTSNQLVRDKTGEIRSVFKNKKESLVHGDFHSSNIFVNKKQLKVFDTEFSFFAPSAYDLGRLTANIIINYSSLIAKDYSVEKKNYQNYLLLLIEDIYNKFKSNYFKLCNKHLTNNLNYFNNFFADYFYEFLSFTAVTMIMRVYNEGLCLDLKLIKNLKKRSQAQGFIIDLAFKILQKNKKLKKIEELTALVADYSFEYQCSKIICYIQDNYSRIFQKV